MTIGTLVALAASFWLLRHDGTWDVYRQPLFLPFLSTSVLMTVFSTTAMPAERGDWRRMVARAAVVGAIVQGLAAAIVSGNPILDLHAKDIVLLAGLEALLIAGAGAATELGERRRPGTWIRTAWCAVALMLILAIVPPVLLAVH